MNNYFNPKVPRFRSITVVNFNVASGAAGYVDTNCSSVGIRTNPFLIMIRATGSCQTGIRAHGETYDTRLDRYGFTFTYMDNAGHCDLLRDVAATITYTFVGYFE